MMKTVAAMITATLLGSAPALADTRHHEYRAYLGGLPLGTLHTELTVAGDAYRAGGRFELSSIIGIFFKARGQGDVEGVFRSGGVSPARFSYAVNGSRNSTGEMVFDGGSPASFEANPARDPRDYDMKIAEAAGALDPASAVVLLSAPRAEACALSLDVFDGRKRHRLSLFPAKRASKQPGITKCEGRYERVAGFKDKHMADDQRVHDFELWLKGRADGAGWIPQRIKAATSFGPAVIALRD